MTDLENREAFEKWFKMIFNNLHHAIWCGDLVAKNYKKAMWQAWQASAQREGFKLAPLEMSWQKADDLAILEWGKNKHLFCSENRDLTAMQIKEFRLRWCKIKAHEIMDKYKAMINAV